MKMITTSAKLAVSIAGLLVSGATFAQATWDWGNAPACDPATCTVSGVTATVSAYGGETSAAFLQSAIVRDLDPNNGVGLGITSSGENTTSPNHSIDNFNKNSPSSSYTGQGGADYAEVLAINFSQAVSLTNVAVSWTWNDSDAMIFRWDNALAPNLLTTAPSALPTTVGGTSNGWTLVASGDFDASGNQIGFASSKYSSYWLVSTALGQSSTSKNNDGFKVKTFSGNICAYTPTNGDCIPPSSGGGSVPEPGSLALAAVAFMGLKVTRRRRSVAH